MRKCSICSHPDRLQIDASVLKGQSYRDIARQFATDKDNIARHVKAGHVSKPLQEAQKAAEAKHGIELTSLLKECLEISLGSAREARAARDFRAIGSIMSGPYKAAEILSRATSDDGQESGLQAMRAELKAMREGHVETPAT